MMDKATPKTKVPQLEDFNKILIEKLKYSYPTKSFDGEDSEDGEDNESNKQIPFTLEVVKPITLRSGQIVRLDGGSGNGKSTFMNIMGGVIPHEELDQVIKFDGIDNLYGFEAVTTKRRYVQQQEIIDTKASPFSIITGKYLNNFEEVDPCVERIVWKAICLACADDFLKTDQKINDEKKWIHSKNVGLSGGQEARLRIARFIYHMLTKKPKFVILDEIDVGIQGDLAAKITEKIFKYCRKHKILCLVSAHSTEVKKMTYDVCIRFDQGKVIRF